MPGVVGLVVMLVWIAGWVTLSLRRGDRLRRMGLDRYVELEQAANYSRRKDIEPSLYYEPDLSQLPKDDGSNAYANVKKSAARQMIRFSTQMSNHELKLKYGRLQLEYIAMYEENYQRYLSDLIKWAEFLTASGQSGSALRILLYTVDIGSEYRKSFLLAADILADLKDKEQLETLMDTAEEQVFTDLAVKSRILAYIALKKQSLEQNTEEAQ